MQISKLIPVTNQSPLLSKNLSQPYFGGQSVDQFHRQVPRFGHQNPEERIANRAKSLLAELAKRPQNSFTGPPYQLKDFLVGKTVLTPAIPQPSSIGYPLTPPPLQQIECLEGTIAIGRCLPDSPFKRIIWPNALIAPTDPRIQKKLGKEVETDFLASYADHWEAKRAARDLLQNFFDAHREPETGKATLAGVNLTVTRANAKSPYIVRIEGKGEYDHLHVEEIGGSPKVLDNKAAGGFGEGLKIASLALLSNPTTQTEKMTFACRNWKTELWIKPNEWGKPKLHRTMQLKPDAPGNSLEIQTRNPQLVYELFQAVHLFYHPFNPDFLDPSYENEMGGFKVLKPENKLSKGKGNVYLVGQLQEHKSYGVTRTWRNGVEGLHIWSNQRHPDHAKNPTGRDRGALDDQEIEELIIQPMVKKMTDQELINNIQILEEVWKPGYGIAPDECLLKCIITEAAKRKLGMVFSKNCLSGTTFNTNIETTLKQAGNQFFRHDFETIGMRTVEDAWAELVDFKGIQPTEKELIRINVLKKMAQLYSKYYQALKAEGKKLPTEGPDTKPLFSDTELANPIYLYNRQAHQGAEHMTGRRTQTHIWMDRTELQQDLAYALAIYLHELTHVHGDDNTEIFSYKLTDMIALILHLSLHQPQSPDLEEIQALMQVWAQTKEAA